MTLFRRQQRYYNVETTSWTALSYHTICKVMIMSILTSSLIVRLCCVKQCRWQSKSVEPEWSWDHFFPTSPIAHQRLWLVGSWCQHWGNRTRSVCAVNLFFIIIIHLLVNFLWIVKKTFFLIIYSFILSNTGTEWSARRDDLTSIQQRVRATTPKNLQDILLFTASDDSSIQCWRPFKVLLPNIHLSFY